MLKMMMAIGAASVMTTVILANTTAMAMFGAQAVLGASSKKFKPDDKVDSKNSAVKDEDS